MAIVAVMVPAMIVTSSLAKRSAKSAARLSQDFKSSQLATKLPLSLGSQVSASRHSNPERSYSERMGKGQDEANRYPDDISQMSSPGRRAYLQAYAREQLRNGAKSINGQDGGGCLGDDPDCEEEEGGVGLSDKQSEMGIAVDPSGLNVVIGFNEAQGFSTNPNMLSGFATSHDGGTTFTVTGTMPSPGNQSIGATLYPQIFGDPDIKWITTGVTAQTPNGGVFVYASIEVHTIAGPTGTGTVQTLCIHRSTDFGNTWTGPFEVTPATNPNGTFSGNNARDAADKELIDVDPDTGRLMVAWSNFTSTTFAPTFGKQMFTTFSDDIATAAVPTWSARQNVNLAGTINGQGIIPRFAGNGSPNVYVTYQNQTTGLAAQEFFARSTDNGVSFTPAVALTAATFKVMDYVLGNDRSHDFPWMAVDNSPVVATRGNVYIVYADNTLNDGADIAFQKSIDGGLNFTAPVNLNARPGTDRPQWFPVVTVDTTSGRVWVFYYDQGVADSGDTMETSAVYSDDGGVTWSKQVSLSDRPFHAGYGNDTGQPNLGDYNAGVAQGGNLYSTFAYCPNVVLFTDGQPAGTFPAIDAFFKKTSETPARAGLEIRNHPPAGASMLQKASTLTGEITVPLTNITTNALDTPVTYTGVSATLSTTTPNVTVTTATSAYPNIAAGATQNNTTTFIVQFGGGFVFGTKVDFVLTVTTAQGNRTLLFSENSGNVPILTSLLAENFNAAVAPALPAGWTASHAGGANTVPWKTDNHKPKDNSIVSPGLFHVNANDGVAGGDPTRFERAFSPLFVVPAASNFVAVDFDITYDTEDDPSFIYQAYDGVLLRITDQTAGRTLRSVLTEAFAEQQQTGNIFHYPKHFPRNNSASYFQDMSAWSGDSSVVPGNNTGVLHVHMLFPGMGGSTAQLRFEYAQDGSGICTDVRPTDINCGVLVDNVVVNNVTYNALPTAADGNIGGIITDANGSPVSGVTINLSGTQSREAITDSAGHYSFDSVETNGFYTVAPSRANYTFTPENRSFSLLGVHTDASFTATANNGNVNPLDTNEFFVRQHYLDFLGREPDAPGFAGWVSTLNNCAGGDSSCDRVHVSEAFYRSQEFQERGYFAYRFYSTALGRKPDYTEFAPDLSRVSGFLSADQLAAAKTAFIDDFMTRPAFARQYDSLSDTQFVDKLLQNSGVDLSGRRQELIDALRTRRLRRAAVLREIAESSEVYQKYYNQAFVVMEYFGYLHRDPDALYTDWIRALDANPADSRRMVDGFVNSAEYRNRFVP